MFAGDAAVSCWEVGRPSVAGTVDGVINEFHQAVKLLDVRVAQLEDALLSWCLQSLPGQCKQVLALLIHWLAIATSTYDTHSAAKAGMMLLNAIAHSVLPGIQVRTLLPLQYQ